MLIICYLFILCCFMWLISAKRIHCSKPYLLNQFFLNFQCKHTRQLCTLRYLHDNKNPCIVSDADMCFLFIIRVSQKDIYIERISFAFLVILLSEIFSCLFFLSCSSRCSSSRRPRHRCRVPRAWTVNAQQLHWIAFPMDSANAKRSHYGNVSAVVIKART